MSFFTARPRVPNFLRVTGVYVRQIAVAVVMLLIMNRLYGANENYPALLTAFGGFFTVLSLAWSLAKQATGDAALRTEDVGEMNQLITFTAVIVTFAGVVAELKLHWWGLWMIVVAAIVVALIFAVLLFGLAPGARVREEKAADRRALRSERRATPDTTPLGPEQDPERKPHACQ
jgi:hypothetical protein